MVRRPDAERAYATFGYVCIAILSILSFYPIFYIVSLSLTSAAEWTEKMGTVIVPSNPTLMGYKMIFTKNSIIINAFFVSVLRTAVGTALGLTPTLLFGYIVSRKKLPFRKGIMVFVMITILFNGGLIPTYLVVQETRLYNSFWALIVPGIIDSWNVLIFKQFFENIPAELEESAQMDGAGEMTMMTRIIIPMSGPVIAALGLFTAVGHWNSWFDVLLYIKDEKMQPLQFILRNMFASSLATDLNGLYSSLSTGTRVSDISLRMAVAVIGIVPILCVYPFLQKHFTKGIYIGAVKG